MVGIQNRSVLYEAPPAALVPEGVYSAELIDVRRFTNSFGDRVGLVFKIDKAQCVTQLMRFAQRSGSLYDGQHFAPGPRPCAMRQVLEAACNGANTLSGSVLSVRARYTMPSSSIR